MDSLQIDNINLSLNIIVQGVINLNFDNLLTLEDMILISRINKIQHEQVSKCMPLFINLLGQQLLPTNTYFRKYEREKNYHHDNILEIDEPFTLNSNERVLNLYSLDYRYDNDTSTKIESTKRFIMRIADEKSYTFINDEYKTRHGCGIELIICNSGQCHIFFDEVSIWEHTTRFNLEDKNKKVLVMTIASDNIASLLNLLHRHKLRFLLDDMGRMSMITE